MATSAVIRGLVREVRAAASSWEPGPRKDELVALADEGDVRATWIERGAADPGRTEEQRLGIASIESGEA